MSYHRRAVACELCGQQFFPSSLPFHMKACVVKQQFVEVPCPNCDEPFRQCELQNHIQRDCKRRTKRKPTTNSLPSSSPTFGGLTMCAVCGRKFAADRLVKHQAICRRNSGELRGPLRDMQTAVEYLATPINSNWRAQRDEMKRRIGESRQQGKNLSINRAVPISVHFKTRESEIPHTVSSTVSLGSRVPSSKSNFKPEFIVLTKETAAESPARQLTILDDSLEIENRKPTDPLDRSSSHTASDLNLSISPQPEHRFLEKAGTQISETRHEPTAWTVEWPGSGSRNQPTSKDSVRDPRARLEPVKFEFPHSLSRTTSRCNIPTTADPRPLSFEQWSRSAKHYSATGAQEPFRGPFLQSPSIRFNYLASRCV
jgi:hypothetical protein